ncbi:MAG: ABC transporter substrate-binding protein [Lachnospiraceae bacterium]|jgi:peptide/nickel transport system substrate-binding protein|nr:ABC transporter substrate-binding protein [Lachnospiraceae bacterium]
MKKGKVRSNLRMWAGLTAAILAAMSLYACSGGGSAATTAAPAATAGAPAPEAQPAQTQTAAAETTAGAPAPASTEAIPAPAPAAAEPKKLVIGAASDIVTLDPQNQTQTNTQDLFATIGAFLFKRDLDFVIQPDLVTDYKQVEDTVWEFTIRKGVKFTNGEDLTASDVKFTLDRESAPDSGLAAWTYYKCITGTELVDDYTIRITTDIPRPDMLSLLAMSQAVILPEDFITANGMEAYILAPVTAGVYTLKEWVPDDHYTLIPNPDYYGEKATWDEVVYRPIPESSTRVSELLTGGVDLIYNVPVNEWGRVSSNTDAGGTSLAYGETSRVMLLIVRMTDGQPLSDPLLREAVELAIDKTTICDALLQGAGVPTRTRVGSSVPGFNFDLFGAQADLYNPERAKELLAEAGYAPGELVLDMTASSGRYLMDAEMAQMIAAYLQEVGITVNLELVESTVISTMFTNKENKDLLMIGLSDGQYDGCYPLAHYGDLERGAGQTDYNSPECQKLYQEALVEMNEDIKQEKEREIQAIAAEDRPHICIAQINAIFGVNNKYELNPRMDTNIVPDEVTLK